MQNEIFNSINCLKNNGVILYPTDTIWGIGCDATSETAVNKIINIKNRDKDKGLIILIDSIKSLKKYVENIPDFIIEYLKNTDKPTTVIYSNPKNIAKNLIKEDGSIAIRVTNDTFCNFLIKTFNKPIVSTSANFSGEKFPTYFNEIDTEFKNKVDYTVNYRQDEELKFNPSRIIKFVDDKIIVIRD